MYLGLDLGSSQCKGVLTDGVGAVLALAQRPTPGHVRRRGEWIEAELDVAPLKSRLAELIAALRRQVPGKIRAVAITGQMHGLLLADRQLCPCRPFITWQDSRALGPARGAGPGVYPELAALLKPYEPRTGAVLRPSMMAALVPWLAERGELPSGDLVGGGLANYLTSWLVGEEMLCDPTQAASCGVFDIYRGQWLEPYRRYLEEQGIDVSLPPVVPSGTHLGEVRAAAGELGLSPETSVVLAPGDFQAALLGCGLELGELAINVGTGAQVALAMEGMPPTGEHEVRPWGDGGYLACRSGLPGGRWIVELEEALAEPAVPSRSLRPSLDARALERWQRQQARWYPCRLEASSGRWSFPPAVAASAKPEDLYLSLSRCLAQSYGRAVEELRALSPWPITTVRLAGGHLRHRAVLRRCVEEVVGLPVLGSEHPEEAALGAAMVARRVR